MFDFRAQCLTRLDPAHVYFTENQGRDGSVSSFQQHRGPSPGQAPIGRSDSTNSMDSTSTPRGEMEPGDLTVADGAEKVKMGLLFQAKNLDERVCTLTGHLKLLFSHPTILTKRFYQCNAT